MALTTAQRQKVEAAFDQLLVDAQTPFEEARPTLAQYNGDVAAFKTADGEYKQRLSEYNNNPLRPAVQQAVAEVQQQVAAGATPEQADALLQSNLDGIKQQMMAGVDGDLANERAREQARDDLMAGLWQFNPIKIVTSLMRMMSGTNELLAVPGTMVADLLGERGVDPARAVESSFLTSGVTSGLLAVGVDVAKPDMQRYIAGTVAGSVAPPADKPVEAPATSSPEALSAALNAAGPAQNTATPKADAPFDAPNGAVPPPPKTPPGAPGASVPQR